MMMSVSLNIISSIYYIITLLSGISNTDKCGFDHVHHYIETNHPNRSKRISNLTYNHFIPDILSSIKHSVSYNHNHNHRRQLLIESGYEPIRIVPYWTYLEQALSTRPTDLQFIKELVSASIQYISQFVYTIPVQNNLSFYQYCRNGNAYGCQQLYDHK